jgi:hypothetical protein
MDPEAVSMTTHQTKGIGEKSPMGRPIPEPQWTWKKLLDLARDTRAVLFCETPSKTILAGLSGEFFLDFDSPTECRTRIANGQAGGVTTGLGSIHFCWASPAERIGRDGLEIRPGWR